MGRVWFNAHEHITSAFEDLIIFEPKITNAYFAEKVVSENSSSNTLTVAFNEIHQGILGRDVYIVVETEGFVPIGESIFSEIRANLKINFKTGDCNLTGTADEVLQITDGTADVSEFVTQVGSTEVLNDTEGNCVYTNLEDYVDKAIFKVSFRPNTRDTFDEWAENIYKVGMDLPSIVIQVLPEDYNMVVVYGANANSWTQLPGDNIFANSEGHLFKLENKNVYEIYHGDNLYNNFDEISINGELVRKRIGEIVNDWSRIDQFDEEDPKHIVVYFYRDNNDNIHEICTTERHRIRAKARTNNVPIIAQRGQLLDSVDFTANRAAGEDIDASSLEIYETGTYSDNNGYSAKWYANQNNEVYLIDADIERIEGVGGQNFSALEYNDITSGLRVAFAYQDTRRRFANPILFAGIIGALAELNLNHNTSNIYIISEGFAYIDGSCYPSSGHVNGMAYDTHYLMNQDDQQVFINSLSHYGFGRNIVGCNMSYDNSVNDCGEYGNIHENHMHSDTFFINRLHNIN
ncbi:hypothetical protein H0I23_00810 [Cellulophaga sp. HaHaR_3_176]|uniref:hypothetical protein n=1 Tax=Cellulophaga sp. HaHaR_3_176 TaxID=1942464 RepID=UPI001C201524|nr:hypothetical protein [Cellulophaga sp. HaHaR_3_176]QWX84223.1 hypothetical protein H0I23_00810 [Cellulophaga sp. HaHaR_3_176]